jgi:acyl carrier protein
MQTREEILDQVTSTLAELFEIEPEQVTLAASLNDDLEIDSIDAVDLLDRLRRQTGRKISAEDFRSVKTVGDLVEKVHALLQA